MLLEDTVISALPFGVREYKHLWTYYVKIHGSHEIWRTSTFAEGRRNVQELVIHLAE